MFKVFFFVVHFAFKVPPRRRQGRKLSLVLHASVTRVAWRSILFMSHYVEHHVVGLVHTVMS